MSILEEREYFDIISDFWTQWKYRKAVYSSLAKGWEDGKSKIKGLTIPGAFPGALGGRWRGVVCLLFPLGKEARG